MGEAKRRRDAEALLGEMFDAANGRFVMEVHSGQPLLWLIVSAMRGDKKGEAVEQYLVNAISAESGGECPLCATCDREISRSALPMAIVTVGAAALPRKQSGFFVAGLCSDCASHPQMPERVFATLNEGFGGCFICAPVREQGGAA